LPFFFYHLFLFYVLSKSQGLLGTVAHFAATTLEAALAFLFPLEEKKLNKR